MNKPTLFLTRTEIRHMPGFPNGGLEADNLCSGVNIVYGPNASGKSTLGRAILHLLRPTDPPTDVSLHATFELDGTSLSLDYNMGRVKCQKRTDGSDLTCPPLAPSQIGDRHLLALHDLISSETGEDVAQRIATELAGGYDVYQASRALRHLDRAARPKKLIDRDAAVRKNYDEVKDRQDELLERQGRLEQLRGQKKAAQDAQLQLKWIERAQQCLETRAAVEQTLQHVADFPAGIEKVTPRDVEDLDGWQSTQQERAKEHQSEQQKLDNARALLKKCGLPDEGIPPELVPSLRLKFQRLHGLQEEIKSRRREADVSRAALEQESRAIGPNVRVAQASEIDTSLLNDLFDFVCRANKIHAEQQHQSTLRDWLGVKPPPEDVDALLSTIELLRDWLALEGTATASDQGGLWKRVAAGTATLILAGLMGLLVHPSWFLLLAAGVGLLVWAFWPGTAVDRSQTSRREEIRRKYKERQSEELSSWSSDVVREQMKSLQERRAAALLAHEKQMKWGDLGPSIQALDRQVSDLEQDKQKWVAQLGFDVDGDEEVTLWLLAQNINRFREQQQRLAESQQLLDTATREFDTLLVEMNNALSPYHLAAVDDTDVIDACDDPDTIATRVEQLALRQQQYDSATQALAAGETSLARIADEQTDANNAISALFDRIGLTVEQTSTLHAWAEQRGEYDQAVREHHKAEGRHQQTTNELSERPELLALTADELAGRERQYREQADQLDTISEKIGGIEQAIETARESNDLGTALADQMQAADDLREQREQDYDAVVGGLLAGHIDRQERVEELPPILRRARELFASITHGRYELQVEPEKLQGKSGHSFVFRAKETASGEGLKLQELSSGTRLQLLLAARVAFVERQEQGIKVPLILDETLGNSDDRRAQEMIDAALEICRGGRQLFYFTAQRDEVDKWQQHLKSCEDVEHRVINLATQRDLSESERLPIRDYEPFPTTPVPAPDDLDWLSYGELLQVSHPDPNKEPGDYHLWFLIDDPFVLYELLNDGINKWGQLQTLVSLDRADGISSDSTIFCKAQAAARLLESVLRHRKIGRGNAVDRKALLNSGAVSDTYIDRVTALAEEHAGDAKAILEALKAGDVQRFQKDKREDLRDYLRDQGYLDDREVLSPEEIKTEVRITVYPDLQQGWILPQQFDILLDLLTTERRPPAEATATAFLQR